MSAVRMQRRCKHLSKEEIKEKFGDVPNVEMECGECMAKYAAPMKDACPEWDKECQMNQLGTPKDGEDTVFRFLRQYSRRAPDFRGSAFFFPLRSAQHGLDSRPLSKK